MNSKLILRGISLLLLITSEVVRKFLWKSIIWQWRCLQNYQWTELIFHSIFIIRYISCKLYQLNCQTICCFNIDAKELVCKLEKPLQYLWHWKVWSENFIINAELSLTHSLSPEESKKGKRSVSVHVKLLPRYLMLCYLNRDTLELSFGKRFVSTCLFLSTV